MCDNHEMKTCNTCNETKHIFEFRNRGHRYENKCRTCEAAYQRSSRKRLNTLDKERKRESVKKSELKILLLEKRCICCSFYKPISEFYKYSKSKDGHNSRCKSCFKALQMRHYNLKKVALKYKAISEDFKCCSDCKESKSKYDFTVVKSSSNKLYLAGRCKKCMSNLSAACNAKRRAEGSLKAPSGSTNSKKYLGKSTIRNAKPKVCTRCKVLKPVEEFPKHLAQKDGLRSICRSCNALYNSKPNQERVNVCVKKSREGLRDSYVKRVLKKKGSIITPEMIDLERRLLIIKREVRKHRKEEANANSK